MHITKSSAALLLVIVVFNGAAWGGLLTSDTAAYNDGTTTWRGTQNFAASGLLNVNVDYAVYAPGHFHGSAALGDPPDPSNGSQYVYAYQMFVGGSFAVTAFSVGFTEFGTESADKQVANIGYVPPVVPYPIGVAPTNEAFNGGPPPQSAVWNYSGGLAVGSESPILIYTSPLAPEFDSASVQGGVSAMGRLPSPVPEPCTGLLLALAASILGIIGVNRRK